MHTLQVTGALLLLVLLQPAFKFSCVLGQDACELGTERPHSIPVVLIHWGLRDCAHCHGNPLFLQHSVDVARRSGNRVILLGDDENKHISGAEWHDVHMYMGSAAEFPAVYQHLSSNAHSYEMACFQRMFILRDFMRAQDVAAALHIDSDVLLLANINHVVDPHCVSAGGGAWLRPVQEYKDWWWVESVATALLSLNLLDDLCAFIFDLYTTPQGLALLQKKMDGWVVERGGEGGVCDMTAYFLFSNCISSALSSSSSLRPNAFPDPEEVCPRIRRLVDVGDLTGTLRVQAHATTFLVECAPRLWVLFLAFHVGGWRPASRHRPLLCSVRLVLTQAALLRGAWERARQKDTQGLDFGAVQTCTAEGVFDLNINEADGFAMACDDEQRRAGCIKAVTWRRGQAWLSLEEDGSEVRALSLHLQGGAKSRMPALAAAFDASRLLPRQAEQDTEREA